MKQHIPYLLLLMSMLFATHTAWAQDGLYDTSGSQPTEDAIIADDVPKPHEALESSDTPIPTQPEERSVCRGPVAYNSIMSKAVDSLFNHRPAEVIDLLLPFEDKLHCIDDAEAATKLYTILGIAYLEIGDQTESDRYLTDAILLHPGADIKDLIMLPPNAEQRIEELKIMVEERRRANMDPGVIVKTSYVPVKYETHPFWLNFVPFGTGLFQMGKTGWGIFYASTQVTGIALSIMGGGMVKHYQNENNYYYTHNSYTQAKRWQGVQIAGVSLLVASYVANVIHAICIHEDVTQMILSPQDTIPDEVAYTISPIVLDHGAGLIYATEF